MLFFVLLLAVRTPRLQLLEEVVALVVNEYECREVLNGNLPDSLHTEFGILYALDALDRALRENSSNAAIVTEESLIPCASFAIVFPVQGAIKSASIGRAGPKGSAETMSVTGAALHNSESLDKCSAAVPKRLSVSAAVSLIIGTSSYSSASPSSAGKSFPYVQ